MKKKNLRMPLGSTLKSKAQMVADADAQAGPFSNRIIVFAVEDAGLLVGPLGGRLPDASF